MHGGLLLGDDALGDELLDHGVVEGDRGGGLLVDQVGPAVTRVRDPHLVAHAHDHHAGAAHALGVGVFGAVLGDRGAGEQKPVIEQLARALLAKVLVEVTADLLHGHGRGDLAGVVTTHAVAHDRHVITAAVILLDRNGVLVVFARQTWIARTRELHLEVARVVGALEELVHEPSRAPWIAVRGLRS